MLFRKAYKNIKKWFDSNSTNKKSLLVNDASQIVNIDISALK